MTTEYRIPHVTGVDVTRPHVLRVTFDDGMVKEWEFLADGNEGTVFAPLDEPRYFAQVKVDPESRRSCGPMVWISILLCSTVTSSLRASPTSAT
jgi:hypothetical protein